MLLFNLQFAQVDLSVCYHRPRGLTFPVIFLRKSAEKKWLVCSTIAINRQHIEAMPRGVAWRGVVATNNVVYESDGVVTWLRSYVVRRKSLPTRNMATCAATNNIVTNTYLTSWQSETKSMIFVNNSVQNEYFLVLESTEYYNSTFWEYEILIYLSLLDKKIYKTTWKFCNSELIIVF